MAFGNIFPQSEELTMAAAIKTPFATGLLGLVTTSIPLVPGLNEATMAAAEATFTGYARKTLTVLPAAYPDPVRGGVSFTIPTQQWNVGSPATIGNDIWGGWIEDAGGNLLWAWILGTPFPMQAALSAMGVEITLNFFGNGANGLTINGQPA